MLLAQKNPDCHESLGACLSLGSSRIPNFDNVVKIDQRRRPGGVTVILIDHEIFDGDVSVEDIYLVQGLMAFDTSVHGGKESRTGACLVGTFPVGSKDDAMMCPISHRAVVCDILPS
jgi:hypothetical protein